MPGIINPRSLRRGSKHMNQTSLVGRPLAALTAAVVGFAEKRGVWSGPLTSSSPELARLWAAPTSSTGMGVSEDTALAYSAVWACVSLIASDVASLPLILYQRLKPTGKRRYQDSSLYEILHDSPNSEMSAMTFRETMQAHLLTWGNAYAEIVRDGAGRVAALWPLTPDRVNVRREPRTGAIYYEVSRLNGGIDRLDAADMLHISGLGFDGLMGYSVIQKARESIGLGLATERFGGTFFGNGATFGGVISLNTQLTELAQQSFRKQMEGQHQGVDRSHKFLLLGNEAKYERLGIPPNDAQFLETRQFQINEICRWFRVPPHKIGDLDRSTNNNIEHQGIEYVTGTLRPWLVRWEQEINRKLISRAERKIQYAEHLVEGALRGDMASRYAAYAVGRQWGWLSANDVREKENWNPLDAGGDIYLVPQNMAPADRINDIITAQIAPKPPPVAPAGNRSVEDDAKDAERIVDAITAALVDVETRIAEHASKLAIAEADAVRWKDSAGSFEAEAAEHRANLTAAQDEAGRLKAMHLEAVERADRLAIEQEALRAAAEAEAATLTQSVTDAKAETATVRQTAAADVIRLTEDVERKATLADALAAEQLILRAQEAEAQAKVTLLEAAVAESDTTIAVTAESVEVGRVALEAARAELAQAQTAATEKDAQATEAVVEKVRLAGELTAALAISDAALRRAEESAAASIAAKADAEMMEHAVSAERAAHAETTSAFAAHKQAEAERTQALRTAHHDRLCALALVNRDRLIATLGRLVRVESDRAKRNQGTPAKLKAWSEAFYLDLVDRYADALREEVRGHLVFIGSTQDVDDYTRLLIAPYLQAAVVQVRTIADGDPEDLAVSVERMVSKWERDRPLAIADRLFQEEQAHVNRL